MPRAAVELEIVEVTYVYETDPHLSRICADGWRALFDLADRAAAAKEVLGQHPGAGVSPGASPSPGTTSAMPASSVGDHAPNRRAPRTVSPRRAAAVAEPPTDPIGAGAVMPARNTKGPRRRKRHGPEEHPADAA